MNSLTSEQSISIYSDLGNVDENHEARAARIRSMAAKLDEIVLSAGMAFSEHASSDRFIQAISGAADKLADAFEHSILNVIEVTSNSHLIDLMLRYGLDPDEPGPKHKLTAMHYAVAEVNVKLSLMFIKHGADVNARDSLGRTPMHHMTSLNNYELIARLMVDSGADLGASDAEGQLPLHVALACQGKPLVEYLHSRSNVPASYRSKDGRSFLHYAVLNPREDVVLWLLDQDVDVNARDEESKTPLHVALHQGNHKIAMMLLECGAEANLLDANGNTSLQYALGNKLDDEVLLEKLFKAGADLNTVNFNDISITPLQKLVMIEELAKRDLLGEYGNPKNEKAFSIMTRRYYIRCREELEVWKRINFCDKFSFFDILTQPLNKLVRFFKTKQEQRRCFCEQISKSNGLVSSIYKKDIFSRFKDVNERIELIEWIEVILDETLPPQMPRNVVVQKIIAQMTFNDMRILLKLANVGECHYVHQCNCYRYDASEIFSRMNFVLLDTYGCTFNGHLLQNLLIGGI